MKKKFMAVAFLFFSFALFSKLSYAIPPQPIFEITVSSNVTDSYDYEYVLNYQNYDPNQVKMRGISHWWLEINCAHGSIDENSIYGYSIINDAQHNWIMEFNDNLGSVGGYTDWVIKWDVPDGLEIPKEPGGLIGYFGFHSTQPPITGIWGSKGGILFDDGSTQIPQSIHCNTTVPEPSSVAFFGIGTLGYGIGRIKKFVRRIKK